MSHRRPSRPVAGGGARSSRRHGRSSNLMASFAVAALALALGVLLAVPHSHWGARFDPDAPARAGWQILPVADAQPMQVWRDFLDLLGLLESVCFFVFGLAPPSIVQCSCSPQLADRTSGSLANSYHSHTRRQHKSTQRHAPTEPSIIMVYVFWSHCQCACLPAASARGGIWDGCSGRLVRVS